MNDRNPNEELIRVSNDSRPALVAGAIANIVRNTGSARVRAMGPNAVNQAVKSLIVAKQYLADESVRIVFSPSFVDMVIDREYRTAILFTVEVWPQTDQSYITE